MVARHRESGLSSLVVIISGTVVVVLLISAWFVVYRSRSVQNASSVQSVSTAETCASVPKLELPVDIASVSSVLYPGQNRGGDYKPHGGFRMESSNNDVTVKLPLTAKLIAASRYIEQGEVQYLLDFETNCRLRMRFDHLSVVSLELMEEVNKLPAAKADDSRTTNLSGKQYEAGTIIASKVGFFSTNNATFDFGVYDFNHLNEISQQSAWSAEPKHKTDLAQHAVCWIDYLNQTDKAAVLALPPGDQVSGKLSDYCKL